MKVVASKLAVNAAPSTTAYTPDHLSSSFSASYAGVVAFITVANEGSFARAADRLGVGRSAVSRAVQKLEGQIGGRLFLRTTRSTSLTSDGELTLLHQTCTWLAPNHSPQGVAHLGRALYRAVPLSQGCIDPKVEGDRMRRISDSGR